MKLWDKGSSIDQAVERFTIGNDRELDLRLAKYDVMGSIAHITMLQTIGLITKQELKLLSDALREIELEIETGNFKIEDGVEDIHSQVELMLTSRLGEVGKKIHSGRSRNDQVLVDLKLFFRDQIVDIARLVKQLFDTLIFLAEQHKEKLMPGYTHLQVAMPSSFGLWFSGYAESLADDMLQLEAAYRLANQNPLGSAAGYGSSFGLDRQMTTELLGFDTMHFNVIAAQLSRGKSERSLAAAMGATSASVGRLAMDCCLYMGQNYGFISFADHLTTGSSIMPHKKNPDVLELVRAKCNRIQALPNDLAMVSINLPTGYHRDYQLLKDLLFPAIEDFKDCLEMTDLMLKNVRMNGLAIEDSRYDYLFTVEDLNALVLSGVAFRDAYRQVGEMVNLGTYRPTRSVRHTHQGSIGNLCLSEIEGKMDSILARLSPLQEYK